MGILNRNNPKGAGVPKRPIDPNGTFSSSMVKVAGSNGVQVQASDDGTLSSPDSTLAHDVLSKLNGVNVYPNRQSPLKTRATKLSCLGIPSSILDVGNPEYARTVRLASAYKKVRTREYFQAHGFVSSGVGALLAASSLALAGSRFLYELAASTSVQPEERGQIGLPQLLKLASSLSDSARQNELSAWELCARESIVRRRNETSGSQAPWLVSQQTDTVDLSVKRKPGRPRKATLVQEELEKCQNLVMPTGYVQPFSEYQDSAQQVSMDSR